ncbi:MAG TPA: alkaline phosphatase family protein [Jatrophihabitans sp.]|nr:alkaline phosphatase family protein [Jatrophihabitans sp.]
MPLTLGARVTAVAATTLAVVACASATTPSSAAPTARPASATHTVSSGVVAPGRSATSVAAGTVPRPDHVVVVMEENHSYSDIIGSSSAPYINSLATGGALFTQSFGVTHPSEPNYLALFSGSTHSLTSDSCPHTYTTQNLGSELITAGLTFTGYSESMPSDGYTGCTSGAYARKHNPWVNFTGNVPASSNRMFSEFPTDYTKLPTVSFVIPNLNDDMHDGTVAAGDSWLKSNLGAYATWAKTHNSLLVVTWDEDDSSSNNQIPTIFYGQPVKTGQYSEKIKHYNVLRTLEQAYGLPYVGSSSTATPITDAWQ